MDETEEIKIRLTDIQAILENNLYEDAAEESNLLKERDLLEELLANNITEAHIKEMRHCIGLDYQHPKRGKYEAFRNHCTYYSVHELWEHLVNIGYAELYIEKSTIMVAPNGYYTYSLNRAGLDFMGSITGCTITIKD